MVLAARNRQATLIYERAAELDDGFHPFLTKIEKKCRCCQLPIGYFSKNYVFYPDSRREAAYQ